MDTFFYQHNKFSIRFYSWLFDAHVIDFMAFPWRKKFYKIAVKINLMTKFIIMSPFLKKGRMHLFIHLSIGFGLYTVLQYQSSMSSNFLVFHTSGDISAAFPILVFLTTESSSSWVNGPSLMSNGLLIILVIDSWVMFGGFPGKFSKCSFNTWIRFCWLVAFGLSLAMLFLLFTSHATNKDIND